MTFATKWSTIDLWFPTEKDDAGREEASTLVGEFLEPIILHLVYFF
jgi:hypothetical protein